MLRLIAREAFRLLLPVLLIYVVLLGVSLVLEPLPVDDGRLDSARSEQSFLKVEPAYVAFRSRLVAGHDPAILLIGPSNVRVGLRPELLAPLVPGTQVHNLAVGGANIDGMEAAIDLVYAHRRPGAERAGLVFVLGLWYGEFLHHESNPTATPLARQMMRFGLFRREAGGGVGLGVPPALFDVAVHAARPLFMVQNLLGAQGWLMRWLRPERAAAAQVTTGAAILGDPRDFPLPTAQFERLVQLAEKVEHGGGRLVLADLPQRRDFTRNSPLWGRYQEVKTPWFAQAVAHGAKVVDLSDLDDEADFGDATHPRPEAAPKWARRLADGLRRP